MSANTTAAAVFDEIESCPLESWYSFMSEFGLQRPIEQDGVFVWDGPAIEVQTNNNPLHGDSETVSTVSLYGSGPTVESAEKFIEEHTEYLVRVQ